MKRYLSLFILIGLVSCGDSRDDSRIVSLSCNTDSGEIIITFDEISKLIEMELPLETMDLILKSLEDTPVNDGVVESATLSKLEIDENSYEFTVTANMVKPTRKPDQSDEEMNAEYQRRLNQSELKFKIGRYDLELTSSINNKVQHTTQCNLI